MPQLYSFFPKAKYLHLHRDGPETALSMRNHSYFKSLVTFFTRQATRQELEQTEYAGKPVTAEDPITRRLFDNPPTLAQFAVYWNYQLLQGYSTFTKLDAAQYMEVRYEDLIADPGTVMAGIADFFELPASPGWIDKAAAVIDAKEITSSISMLSAADRESLRNACMSGQILTKRYQHPWVFPTIELINQVIAEHQ
jgi:hypothetical protein